MHIYDQPQTNRFHQRVRRSTKASAPPGPPLSVSMKDIILIDMARVNFSIASLNLKPSPHIIKDSTNDIQNSRLWPCTIQVSINRLIYQNKSATDSQSLSLSQSVSHSSKYYRSKEPEAWMAADVRHLDNDTQSITEFNRPVTSHNASIWEKPTLLNRVPCCILTVASSQ